MNRRPETIADVRQNADEREPVATLRATDPYAAELLEVYSMLLLNDPNGALIAWKELWEAVIRGGIETDRTQGGMMHQRAEKMREFRDLPLWRIYETRIVREGDCGRIAVAVTLKDQNSGQIITRWNTGFRTARDVFEGLYAEGRDQAATILESADWTPYVMPSVQPKE